MKVILCAYHEMGCAALESLLEVGFEIACVFTHEGAASENAFFSSVETLAQQKNIPLFFPADINTPEWQAKIQAIKPDAIFCLSYRQPLGQTIVSAARLGAFNVHASLLPAYRGRAHLNWVLIRNEHKTGVTLHRITAIPDAGPILAQTEVAIMLEDDALSLHRKLVRTTREHMPQWLLALKAGELVERQQDENQASEPGQRKPEDGRIHWTQSADEIYHLIRALTYPWPGAYTSLNTQRLPIWKSRVIRQTHTFPSGYIISTDPLYIACGHNILEIITGSCDSQPHLNAAELSRALKLEPGMQLG